MPGHYEGFFYYGSQKIPESISLKNYSFDTGRTELVGYGENDQYGCFTIMGSMDIAFSKGEEQMIFFGLLNPHLDEAEEEVVEEDGSHEEQEMRLMERELSKVRVKSWKLGRVAFTKEY